MDEKKRDDFLNDNIYIDQKIYLTNYVKILRLGFQIFLLAYYVGSYWFVFVQFFLGKEQNEFINLQ